MSAPFTERDAAACRMPGADAVKGLLGLQATWQAAASEAGTPSGLGHSGAARDRIWRADRVRATRKRSGWQQSHEVMMQLVFEQIRSGGDRNFGYLIGDRSAQRAVLIDPSYSPDVFVERAREQGLQVTHIINTHGHPDHVNGNDRAAELTAATLTGHPLLHPLAPLADGDEMAVGALRFRFLHVPGHAADHLVAYELTHRLLITGDLLFVGKVGGTATDDDTRAEWQSLKHLLSHTHDDATVWPGHDYGVRPSSTVALERRTNPFLLCPDLEAFRALKKSWASFKKEYGLK